MKDFIINERIGTATVRLIDDQGSVVMTRLEALARARAADLDLIMIADGNPQVCRLLDADRYRFEQSKLARAQSRKQRDLAVETKEIQLRPVTDDNDLLIKARRARSFLDGGDKVKIVVRFRGRERTHREQGYQVVDQFLAALGEHKVERPLTANGEMMLLLAPTVSKADRFKQVPSGLVERSSAAMGGVRADE